MLSSGQKIEEDIVLRADAHKLSNLVHLLEHVDVEDFGLALRLLYKTCQHRDCRTFSSSVMAEEGKNLAVIHLDIDTCYCSEPTRVDFLKALNP